MGLIKSAYKNLKKYNFTIKFLGNKNQDEIFKELTKHGIYIHISVRSFFSFITRSKNFRISNNSL